MPHLTLVLPFALPPAEHARDLIAQLHAPVLGKLLPRAARGTALSSPAFDACLPHERWLTDHRDDNSPPLSLALMRALGAHATPGWWFIVQPVHLHVARDHLVLTDYRRLTLTDTEARALYETAAPAFAEQGQHLVYGNAQYWFLRADSWAALRTCSPDAACGHNIDVWQPSGDKAREWRRTHNEVQMLWHQDPVNDARERDGLLRANGLWLWGGTDQADSSAHLQLLAAQLAAPETDQCRHPEQGGTRLIDSLLPFALADDWSDWMRQFTALDEECIAPALEQLNLGKLASIQLILSDSSHLSGWTVTRSSMRKFWVKSSLFRLAS